jgi:hypothetical protein
MDAKPQQTADASLNFQRPSNPFDDENLRAGAYSTDRFTRFGAALLNSPQAANAQAYANAQGVSQATPEIAGQYLKSTLPPEKVDAMEQQHQKEYQVVKFIQDRDQFGTEIAKQYLVSHPHASDDDIYQYVHSNLLNAGKDNARLPAFTIDPHTKEVKTDVGVIHGFIDRVGANVLGLVQAPAEAGARLVQQGVYQASKPFYGSGEANPYGQAVVNQNAGLEHFNAGVENALPGSTFGKEHPFSYGLIEEGAAQVPSLLVLGGLGKAGALGKVTEYGTIAGMEFNKAYGKVYTDAVQSGSDPVKAAETATITAVADAAVNTYLMKFGLLGQKGGEGLKGRLLTALTSAPAQGGVAGTQELIRQLSSYAVTGKDQNLEDSLQATLSGGVAGAVGGFAMPAHGTAKSGEALAEKAKSVAPDAATMKELTTNVSSDAHAAPHVAGGPQEVQAPAGEKPAGTGPVQGGANEAGQPEKGTLTLPRNVEATSPSIASATTAGRARASPSSLKTRPTRPSTSPASPARASSVRTPPRGWSPRASPPRTRRHGRTTCGITLRHTPRCTTAGTTSSSRSWSPPRSRRKLLRSPLPPSRQPPSLRPRQRRVLMTRRVQTTTWRLPCIRRASWFAGSNSSPRPTASSPRSATHSRPWAVTWCTTTARVVASASTGTTTSCSSTGRTLPPT